MQYSYIANYFRLGQKRSRLRPEILAAFCVNRSGGIKEKTSHIADIQGFLEFGQFFAHPSLLFLTGERKAGFEPVTLSLGS